MWLVGVVRRRWVESMGVGGNYGCGCKEVYVNASNKIQDYFTLQHLPFFAVIEFFDALTASYKNLMHFS